MSTKSEILLFKALGEETKFRIIELLMKNKGRFGGDGEYCACEIPALIQRTQSNTSMHLAKLQEWGILKSRREGHKILYSLRDKRVAAIFSILRAQAK